MAKKSQKKKAGQENALPSELPSKDFRQKSIFRMPASDIWMPFLLAVVTFLIYWPSLKSDFVYDAHIEIMEEGFITSLSNLPAVLSLKVLGMNLMLGSRPGQMLYLMLIAAVCGKNPWGYHLCSNLLHAANVALLFVLLRRLMAAEQTGLTGKNAWKAQLAAIVVTLIFALHPIATESVAAVSYSSDLLVTYFTLLALLAATAFRPDDFQRAMVTGVIGTLCALVAVTCKESGMVAISLLIVYWFLYRRKETKAPWLLFLGAATVVTGAFLAARFLNTSPNVVPATYLGGSFSQVFFVQPRLWAFMMGKLVWPVHLSADYTLENVSGLSTPLALAILVIVVLLQIWLASKSWMGALGVAIYWLGLATVSNFIPLYRFLADRFYYLPLAGVAVQLLALFLLTLKSRWGFWITVLPFMAAVLPLTTLTLARQNVFADTFSLWSDTVQISPFSSNAHDNLGWALFQKGQVDEAVIQFQKALETNSNNAEAYYNLGNVFSKKGQRDKAIEQYQKSLQIDPYFVMAHYNLGNIFLQAGRRDAAIEEFKKALEISPTYVGAHNNLGNALLQMGQIDQAMVQFQEAVKINPNDTDAHNNLGVTFAQKGRPDEAISQYEKTLEINSNDPEANTNLGLALYKKGRLDEAMIRFQKSVEINPNDAGAHDNLGVALAQKGRLDEAIIQFQKALEITPNYADAQQNLTHAQSIIRKKDGKEPYR